MAEAYKIALVSRAGSGTNNAVADYLRVLKEFGHDVTEVLDANIGSTNFSSYDLGVLINSDATASNIESDIAKPCFVGIDNATEASGVTMMSTRLDITTTIHVGRNESGANPFMVSDDTHDITDSWPTSTSLNSTFNYGTFSYPAAVEGSTPGTHYVGTMLLEGDSGGYYSGDPIGIAVPSGTSKITSGTTSYNYVVFTYHNSPYYASSKLHYNVSGFLERSLAWLMGEIEVIDTTIVDGTPATNETFSGETEGNAPADWTLESGSDVVDIATRYDCKDYKVMHSNSSGTTPILSFDNAGTGTDKDIYFRYKHVTTNNIDFKLYVKGGAGVGAYLDIKNDNTNSKFLVSFEDDATPARVGSQQDYVPTNGYQQGQWLWGRFWCKDNGATVDYKYKLWTGYHRDEPASWTYEQSDTALNTVAGGSEVLMYDSNVNNLYMTVDVYLESGGLNSPPATPTISNSLITQTGVTLTGSAYSDPDSDPHSETKWEVATDSGFSTIVYTDTGSTDLLEHVVLGLAAGTAHWARVSYKDDQGSWSTVSSSTTFTTDAGTAPDTPTVWVQKLTEAAITLKTSNYSHPDPPSSEPSHTETEWVIASDSGFSTILWSASQTGTRLTETFATTGITAGTTVYARARHWCDIGLASGWGLTGAIAVPGTNSPPNTPTVSAGTITTATATFTGSTYVDSDSNAHVSTDWQVAAENTFETIMAESIDDTTNLTSWTPTAVGSPGTTYYVKIRYRDSTGAYSAWSTATSFALLDLPVNVGTGTYGSFVITSPRTLRPMRGTSISVTVNPTPSGDLKWDLDYSDDYGGTWTSVMTDEVDADYTWDISVATGAALTDGTQYVLRARMHDTVADTYSDYDYQPFAIDLTDKEAAGNGVFWDSAAERVTDGVQGNLNDWTDLGSEDGTWGTYSNGLIKNYAPEAVSMENDCLVLDEATPATTNPEIWEVCVRGVHVGAEAGWNWSIYWDLESSWIGAGLGVSGTTEATKNGIFLEAGAITYEAYGGYDVRAAGQADFNLRCYENGLATHTADLYTGNGDDIGNIHCYSLELGKTPYYTIRLRVETLQINSDGSRNLRVRGQIFGLGLTSPDNFGSSTSPWHFDEVWNDVNLPLGGAGPAGSHVTRSNVYGQGERQYSEYAIYTDFQTTPLDPEDTPDPATPTVMDCPTPYSEKIRYLDRRLDSNSADVTSVYSAPTTTWTIPYEAAVDGSDGTLVVVNPATNEIYTSTRPAATTIAVSGEGDLTATQVFIGLLYTFQYEPTPHFLRDREGRVDDRGRLTLRYEDIRVHETTDLSVIISRTGRADQTITLNEALAVDAVVHFATAAKNEDLSMVLKNATPGGCALTYMEWEGTLTQRNRRI